MSISIHIDIPDHDHTITKVWATDITNEQLDEIISRIARVAAESIRIAIGDHVRTGETLASVTSWSLGAIAGGIGYAAGSMTRGAQLYWLDAGRREVRPVTARYLHYFTWPEQVEVFSRYSAATMPLGFMRRAGLDALAQSSPIIEEVTKRTI